MLSVHNAARDWPSCILPWLEAVQSEEGYLLPTPCVVSRPSYFRSAGSPAHGKESLCRVFVCNLHRANGCKWHLLLACMRACLQSQWLRAVEIENAPSTRRCRFWSKEKPFLAEVYACKLTSKILEIRWGTMESSPLHSVARVQLHWQGTVFHSYRGHHSIDHRYLQVPIRPRLREVTQW